MLSKVVGFLMRSMMADIRSMKMTSPKERVLKSPNPPTRLKGRITGIPAGVSISPARWRSEPIPNHKSKYPNL
jgi:hypothetical protein